MTELMGTLRPVKQLNRNDPSSVEAIGDVTASVRYKLIEPENVIQLLDDDVTLAFAEGADGHALFDQGGNLLSFWQIIVPMRGEKLRLTGCWGFPAPGAIAEEMKRHEAASGTRG